MKSSLVVFVDDKWSVVTVPSVTVVSLVTTLLVASVLVVADVEVDVNVDEGISLLVFMSSCRLVGRLVVEHLSLKHS